MRLITYCLMVLLFASSVAIALPPDYDSPDKGKVRGVVVDAQGHPIGGISVMLKGTLRGTITLEDGSFEILGIPAGDYILSASAVHLKIAEQRISIKAQQVTEVKLIAEELLIQLDEIIITGARGTRPSERLPEVEDAAIFAGKKTEVVRLDRLDANLITNNARQVFAKVPGISIWENDGSGVQVGVASRGLSPNRSWEFNVRQNGYDISADIFGYPEAYYNPPMEAVERIQIVRGASSLQYGPQFGGLLNYVLKRGDAYRKISVETQQSVGSFGMLSTFNAVGGTVGKLNYYGYVHHRQADGWRQNSAYNITNLHLNLNYAITNKLNIGFEISRLFYKNQQPGGLTDAQFAQDARQSSRARNWFSTPWTVPAVTADYQVTEKWKSSLKVFGLIAERNSIGYVRAINIADTINAQTGQFNPRQLDRDLYRNWGAEWRNIVGYQLLGKEHSLAVGLRYFKGFTRRKQNGRADTGSDFNLNLQESGYPRDLEFFTNNTSFYAENIFRLTSKWSVTPGVRYEIVKNTAQGQFGRAANGAAIAMPYTETHRHFLLAGIGTEVNFSEIANLYANISQAYRPVLFSEITPPATTDVIDENLRDASGFNADLGVRGSYKNLITYDVSVFYLQYDNRIGTLNQIRADGSRFQLRTNVGGSRSQGIESYIEVAPVAALTDRSKWGYINLFASLSWIDAQYTNLRIVNIVNNALVETNLKGNRVENAPTYIHRIGATYTNKGFSATWQLSAVGEAFADANNTRVAPATAVTGLIPAYRVMDISATWRFLQRYNLKAGINNLTDERYFTRRAGGYPGPGILPGDGRNWYISIGARF
ncbi:MAG: TonB-dependent receptor [Cytophagales bacterium]|nr:TonB-dependent receptor [Bernardetiaceae bacterium]MDW8205591.1 TonB-dependent receptor [Cytophagales bacterium]